FSSFSAQFRVPPRGNDLSLRYTGPRRKRRFRRCTQSRCSSRKSAGLVACGRPAVARRLRACSLACRSPCVGLIHFTSDALINQGSLLAASQLKGSQVIAASLIALESL